MLEVTECRPMNNEYANADLKKNDLKQKNMTNVACFHG